MNLKKLLNINKKIILASQSPRRKILLEQMGLEFLVIASDFDESELYNEIPSEYVTELARGKAEFVARYIDYPAIIIGSDTTVYFENNYLNKPNDEEDAKNMLRKLSGGWHSVFSGICVIDTESGKIKKDYSETKVKFRELSGEEVDAYVASGSPLDKAGAYGIQDDFGAVFVEKIEGDFYNVVGLPIVKLFTLLKSI
jgi:nucleoside triphosphate pyrophosphatase